jgi:hemerythrin-like domain-containing protein
MAFFPFARESQEAQQFMPVQIRASAHSFSNPTALLSDCHRRIEMFLASLEAVGRVIDQPLTDEAARALTSALRYFREAALKHNADEEESLFPRLRDVQHPDVQSALAQLEGLENDHCWAAALHAEVERLGQHYLSNASLSAAEVESFRTTVADLTSMYRQHIKLEDNLVFPAAARFLSQTDKFSIGEEMAARREVKVVRESSQARSLE